ncbi:MAG: CPBP family intramembrane glutamic endopeptidase [Pseudomonadota bacterium]
MHYIPYICFALSLALCWASKKAALIVFAGSIIAAWLINDLHPGVFVILSAALSFAHGGENKTAKITAHLCFTVFCLLLFFHEIPWISNVKIFDAVHVGTHCTPFTMVLNMENGLIAGVLLCGFIPLLHPKLEWRHFFSCSQLIPIARTCAEWKQIFVSTSIYGSLCILTLMGAALALGHVTFNPKFPTQTAVFLLNNLMLVCMAEEAFFRGYIQKNLSDICQQRNLPKTLALVAASLLFGLRHYQSGVPIMILSTIAGLFYGAAYMRGNRIESAILVHFGLNAVHFFFFSYPALMR